MLFINPSENFRIAFATTTFYDGNSAKKGSLFSQILRLKKMANSSAYYATSVKIVYFKAPIFSGCIFKCNLVFTNHVASRIVNSFCCDFDVHIKQHNTLVLR